MSLFENILLIGSILIVGIIAMIVRTKVSTLSRVWLCFSGAFLVSITFLHLFPIIFEVPGSNIGIWIIAGFFGQLILEQFSSGIEHGHLHLHHHKGNFALAFQIMLGLCVHSFVEGLSLGGYDQLAHVQQHSFIHGLNPLLLGIILHHAPAAFALVLILSSSGFGKWTILGCLVLFGVMPSVGAMVETNILLDSQAVQKTLAFVAGSFLHVATTILFETDGSDHHLPYKNIIATLLGVGLALLTI